MATSMKGDKKNLKNFHFLDEDYNDTSVPITAAANGYGWEIDIVDGASQVIKVCAELDGKGGCDNKDPISTDNIYVINTGSGSFDSPTGRNGKKNRLIYKNKVGPINFAHITAIKMNVSDPSEKDQLCTDSECSLYISQQ